MKHRLITAGILIPIIITTLFLVPPCGFILITLAVCMLSAWEWGQFAGLSAHSQRICLTVLCGLLLVIMMLTVPTYQPFVTVWQAQYSLLTGIVWWLAALFLVLCYPRSATFWRDSKLLRLAFGMLTIFPFFWGVLTLRQHHYGINHLTGAWWLLYVMLLVWGADSGAYVFGRTLGRHKLAPKVSPDKTWEGLIGGLVTSVMMAWLFGKYTPLNTASLTLLMCSVITSLASAIGDLTESMLKREADIKDSGHLIPGHGGILDRIDSLTAAVPVFTYLICF